jgi:hypothetical protein
LASCVALLCLGAGCARALREPPTVTELAGKARHAPEEVDRLLAEAERAYTRWTCEAAHEASSLWLAAAAADPTRLEAWAGAARAAVWIAERAAEPAARESATLGAIQAGQLCAEAAPEDPLCAYWLAVGLGIQARDRRATANDALPRIVKLLERAAEESPELEHAGPDRVLALVRLRAPGWPFGPGDPDLALLNARRAVELDPGYPPNQMCLAEALAETDQNDESRGALAEAGRLAHDRRQAGDPQAGEWLEEIDRVDASGWGTRRRDQ